jgi:hypothetical protein
MWQLGLPQSRGVPLHFAGIAAFPRVRHAMNTKGHTYTKPESRNSVLPSSRSTVLPHCRHSQFQEMRIAAKPCLRLAVMPFMWQAVVAVMRIDVITACRVAPGTNPGSRFAGYASLRHCGNRRYPRHQGPARLSRSTASRTTSVTVYRGDAPPVRHLPSRPHRTFDLPEVRFLNCRNAPSRRKGRS